MAGERTHTVSVRLSPVEHAVWVAAARGAGRGRLGSWVRDRVTATLSADASPTSAAAVPAGGGAATQALGVSAGEWAGLRAELGRVGNNLNQAVRVTNASGVNPARVAEMADAAQGVRVAVAGLLAAVRAVTGEGPVAVPVVGSRSVAEQLSDAEVERRVQRRAGELAERLYTERVARNRAVMAERLAARRAADTASAGESPAPVAGVGEQQQAGAGRGWVRPPMGPPAGEPGSGR